MFKFNLSLNKINLTSYQVLILLQDASELACMRHGAKWLASCSNCFTHVKIGPGEEKIQIP
jgi:hypothetical protein